MLMALMRSQMLQNHCIGQYLSKIIHAIPSCSKPQKESLIDLLK